MSLLRRFNKEVVSKSSVAKPSTNGTPPVAAGKGPGSGGLIDPFADGETSEQPDDGTTPDSGGLIDPFAEDAAPPESGDGSQAQAKQFYDEAETSYQKGEFDEAAGQYHSAYKSAGTDQRGSLAFNTGQAHRRAKKLPYAAVWFQKALSLGGPGVDENRDTIEQLIAEVQEEMKNNPERGPDGEDIGEAKMLFQQAEIAYEEGDYAGAVPLYKQAYERSNEPALLFNVGQACRNGGKYADAKYHYREYLRQVPESPHKAEVEKMIEELKQKVPDPPELDGEAAEEDAKAKFEQAEVLYKSGLYSQAADLYVEVYDDPAVAFARGEMAFNMGQCMRQTGNARSAVEWYKKALEFFPPDSPDGMQIADWITQLSGTKVPLP